MSSFTFKPTFGAVATTNAGTGGLFGTTATPAAATPAFGFGASAASTAPAFGTPAAASTGFGGFGTSTATTSATGFTGFGSTAPAFGAQPAASTTPAFGGFGTTPATSVASVFGTGTTGFGTSSGFGTTGTGFGTTGGAFGTTGTGFGGATSGFGLKPGQTSFGSTGTATGGLFGTQAAQQQQQQQANAVSNIIAAVTPVIFGDERDTVLTKWNQLQAFWGAGKGFFNQQGQSVDFTPDNPFSFFKAVGYNVLPSNRNEDGLVALTIDRKMSEVCDNQQAIVDLLQRIVTNSQPNTTLCVEGIRPLVDDKTEMVIYVQQRANTGVTTRVMASDLFNHLNTATVRQNLTSQLAVSAALPKTGMTAEQKKLYLDNPPAGIDGRIWEQAKLDNPDPEQMIPVPMVGFTELHNRLKHQEQQTSLHQARLDLIANDIASLQRNQADVVAKTEEYKRNQLVLGHRVLKVLVKQELYRKHGYAIQADEEQLRTKLETIYAELSAPMQFKGRLSELMSQLRMQSQLGVAARYDTSYQIEPSVQQELKQHLKRQQEGLSVLLQVLKDDLNELKIIEQGLADAAKPRR